MRLVCALVEDGEEFNGRASLFSVEVSGEFGYLDLKNVVTNELDGLPLESFDLLRAQDEDNQWLHAGSLLGFKGCNLRENFTTLSQTGPLGDVYIPRLLHDSRRNIHVLVVVPSAQPKESSGHAAANARAQLQLLLDTATSRGILPPMLTSDENFESWTSSDNGKVKDLQHPATIFPSLPSQYYVRTEALMVWKVFKKFLDDAESHRAPSGAEATGEDKASSGKKRAAPERLVFVGTPGVGKSTLLMQMCLWSAVTQKQDVVLVQIVGLKVVISVLLGSEGVYYVWNDSHFDSSVSHPLVDFKRLVTSLNRVASVKHTTKPLVCLDGICQSDINRKLWGMRYDLYATSGSYNAPACETRATIECLVPFWSQCDLLTMSNWLKQPVTTGYEVSGGSVRLYLFICC